MTTSASRVALKDRRDQMLLTMAIEVARTKSKSREILHNFARQAGYRRVRYQKFKGRRGDATEEEVYEALRERREKSIRFMEGWWEAQLRANAEEGTSRPDSDSSDEASLRLLAPKDSKGSVT